jgi:hypothetical protein
MFLQSNTHDDNFNPFIENYFGSMNSASPNEKRSAQIFFNDHQEIRRQ